ncbi:polysaccharide deacetylase family protein [Luteolibacter algae]|uniref:Polysaccharide deacetylase family protein n=1 Tax=Luteolibacter algae TaxID=454151 RepID=A0ABW5D837_9BACT
MLTKTLASLVFDDGFEKSCLKIARIFEERNLHTTFAVLANPCGFLDEFPKGNFTLWNELQKRGHSIHPHGYDHSDLTKITFAEACSKIDACLAYFEQHLSGFNPKEVTYHLTYNRSTPEIDAYLLDNVRAIRTCGSHGLPGDGLLYSGQLSRRSLTCSWHGPDFCDEHLLEKLVAAAASEAPGFLYMLHGLEDEGWGPISEASLARALDFIIESPFLESATVDQLTRNSA